MLSRSTSILAAAEDDLIFAADESPADDLLAGGSGLPDDVAGADSVEVVEPEPETPVPEPEPISEPPPVNDPAPEPPLIRPANPGPDTIDFERILIDRPDVLKGFYEAFNGAGNDRNSTAWAERVGGDTPQAYARYWYFAHGRWEGYAQGDTTADDTVSAERILLERPDVLRGFYESYYGDGNDRSSTAWVKRVGGDTPEAYAKYWYEKYGRWEGYSQSDKAAAEAIDVKRLLAERPDVFRGFFEEFYGENNDRKSHAWVDRVGGDTVEDYAKYWYVAHGRKEGYTQRSAESEEPGDPGSPGDPAGPSDAGPPVHDPADDPWNHPALYPGWKPPFDGWQPPPDIWHGTGGGAETPDLEPDPTPANDPDPVPEGANDPLPEPDPASAASSSLFDPDPFS